MSITSLACILIGRGISMDDLISRQATILALVYEQSWNMHEDQRIAIRVIADLLLTNAQRWIPVTEELPAYGEDVLLSMNRDCSIGYLVPTYDERQYEWHHLGCFYDFDEVDAWMPLPELYKECEQYDSF